MRSVIDSMTELWISKKGLIVKIVMVMAVVAVFQMAGISKDFVSYETYFSGLRNDGVLKCPPELWTNAMLGFPQTEENRGEEKSL